MSPTRTAGFAACLLALLAAAPTSAAATTAVSPAAVIFDAVASGQAGSATTVTLRNTGATELAADPVRTTGSQAFEAVSERTNCGAALAAGASCTVAVRIRAGAAPGWHEGELTLGGGARVRMSGRVSGRAGDVPTTFAPDLGALPAAHLVGDGGDYTGATLASGPCDVNGDGLDDVLTGAGLWSKSPAELSWEGAVYVKLGASSFGSEDLQQPVSGRTVRIEGEQARAMTGAPSCGDINGDEIDDIAIGAWAYSYAGRASGAARGRAYVVFGSRDFGSRGPIDLSRLGTAGFTVTASSDLPEFDHLGYATEVIADVTGDGRDELAVVANTADTTDAVPPRSNNGITYIIAGRAGTETVDVANADSALMTVHGASPGDAGAAPGLTNDIAALGDVDGDGTGDFAIGSHTAEVFGRRAAGAAAVVSGAKRGRVDLADPAAYMFAVGGASPSHRAGISVGRAGDINGDGLADLLIGADSTSGSSSDAAYVIYGRAAAPGNARKLLDGRDLGLAGYRILGGAGTSTGFSLAGVPDSNGDGRPEVLIGAYDTDAPESRAGRVWLVNGIANPTLLPLAGAALAPADGGDTTRTLSLAGLTAGQGSSLDGAHGGGRFGRAVAFLGDVNGDGGADHAVGSDLATRLGRKNSGETSVLLGAPKVPANPWTEPPAAPVTSTTTVTVLAPGVPVPVTAERPAPHAPVAGAGSRRSRIRPSIISRYARVDRNGRITVSARCVDTTGPCTIGAYIKQAGRRTRSATVAAQPRQVVRLRLTLAAAQRRSLARHRGLIAARLYLSAGESNGGAVSRRVVMVRIEGRR